MNESFDLQEYLSKGIEHFVADVVKATLKNPRESAFMLKFAAATAAASRKRKEAEARGQHIPSFLIASITSQCNLHCAGCYSRCNHATVDEAPVQQLTDEEWRRIFSEADELGISFILLAGGEPMLRRDIIEAAGKRQNILFPIFTNGTFMDKRYFELFDRSRVHRGMVAAGIAARAVQIALAGDAGNEERGNMLPRVLRPAALFGGGKAGRGELRHEHAFRGIFQRGLQRVGHNGLHALLDVLL